MIQNVNASKKKKKKKKKTHTISSAMIQPKLFSIWFPVTQSYINFTPCLEKIKTIRNTNTANYT